MRALDLSRPGFRPSLVAHAPRGSAAYAAILATLRELSADASLPGPADALVRLRANVMARLVPGTNLAIAYVAGPDVVHVLAIIPVP